MNLLHLNSASQESSHKEGLFLEAFRSEMPCWETSTFFSVDNLVEALKIPFISFESIVLLHIHNEAEIDQVLEQASLFSDADTIMILSNISSAYSSKCYQIYPRMVFGNEPDPMTLISILIKKITAVVTKTSGCT
jgi:hypothetical protein